MQIQQEIAFAHARDAFRMRPDVPGVYEIATLAEGRAGVFRGVARVKLLQLRAGTVPLSTHFERLPDSGRPACS